MSLTRILLAAAVLVVVVSPTASARWQGRSLQPVAIHNAFFTGTQYLALPEQQRWFYVSGLVDGIMLAPFFDAPKANLARFEACLTGMDNHQVAALLASHLQAHPESWHLGAHLAMYNALRDRCP